MADDDFELAVAVAIDGPLRPGLVDANMQLLPPVFCCVQDILREVADKYKIKYFYEIKDRWVAPAARLICVGLPLCAQHASPPHQALLSCCLHATPAEWQVGGRGWGRSWHTWRQPRSPSTHLPLCCSGDFRANPDYKGVCHVALAQEGHCKPGVGGLRGPGRCGSSCRQAGWAGRDAAANKLAATACASTMRLL